MKSNRLYIWYLLHVLFTFHYLCAFCLYTTAITIPSYGEGAVEPVWRTLAILFLVVAMLLAFIIIAMVIVVCHTKKELKSDQPSHNANQQGVLTQHAVMYSIAFIIYIQCFCKPVLCISDNISLEITAELDAVSSTDDTKNPVYDATITTPDESKPGSL